MNIQKQTEKRFVSTMALVVGMMGSQTARKMTRSAESVGCPEWRAVAGAATGALVGTAAGSQIRKSSGKTFATIIGTVGGTFRAPVSREGSTLIACSVSAEAETKAMNTTGSGQINTWEIPNSDGSGESARGVVTITKQGTNDDGFMCKGFVNTVEVDGQRERPLESHAAGTPARNGKYGIRPESRGSACG